MVLLLAAPFLLTASSFAPLAVAGLAAPYALRLGLTGKLARWSPVHLPLALLVVMTFVSLYPAIDRSISWPKFYGILLQIGAFYAALNWASTRTRLLTVTSSLLLALFVLSVVGVLATDVQYFKFFSADWLYVGAPRVELPIISSTGQRSTSINANELGGTLGFLLPLPVALVWKTKSSAARLAAAGVTAIAFGVLLFTQSRAGLAGVAVSFLALWVILSGRPVLRNRLFIAAAVAAIMAATLIVLGQGRESVPSTAFGTGPAVSAAPSLPGRLAIWERALTLIQDSPLAGIGLNNFPVVAERLYPRLNVGTYLPLPHAHNVFLQVALDLGVPGLAAFLVFLIVWVWSATQALRRLRGPEHTILAGCLAGLISFSVFGLVDAISLGAKPLVVLWALLGLGMAIIERERAENHSTCCPGPLRSAAGTLLTAGALTAVVYGGISAARSFADGPDLWLLLLATAGAVAVVLGLRWTLPTAGPGTGTPTGRPRGVNAAGTRPGDG